MTSWAQATGHRKLPRKGKGYAVAVAGAGRGVNYRQWRRTVEELQGLPASPK